MYIVLNPVYYKLMCIVDICRLYYSLYITIAFSVKNRLLPVSTKQSGSIMVLLDK